MDRDRLLAEARALGLPVPEALDAAPTAEVRRVVRALAQSALSEADGRLAGLERDRAAPAALLFPPPTGHA